MSQSVLRLVGKEDGDKQRALEAALAQIDKAFGKGSVIAYAFNFACVRLMVFGRPRQVICDPAA